MAGIAGRQGIRDLTLPGFIKHVTTSAGGSTVLDVHERTVIVADSPDTTDHDITLPDKANAAGLIFTVTLLAGTGTAEVNVLDAEGNDIAGDGLNAANDLLVFYCDGYQWHVLIDVTSA